MCLEKVRGQPVDGLPFDEVAGRELARFGKQAFNAEVGARLKQRSRHDRKGGAAALRNQYDVGSPHERPEGYYAVRDSGRYSRLFEQGAALGQGALRWLGQRFRERAGDDSQAGTMSLDERLEPLFDGFMPQEP